MKKTFLKVVLAFCLLTSGWVLAYEKQGERIPFDLSLHTPVVLCQIEGKEIQLSFNSASNTASLILKKEILETLKGVDYIDQERRAIDAEGKISVTPMFILNHIQLANSSFHHIMGAEYKPWGSTLRVESNPNEGFEDADVQVTTELTESKIDGVFGLNLFEGKKFILDYPQKEIVLFIGENLPDQYQSTKWIRCKQKIDSEGMVIEARVAGKPGRFIVDTGSTASFLRPSFLGLEKPQEEFQILEFTTERGEDLGSVKFYLHEFAEPQVDGVLGYNFFRQRKLVLENKGIGVAGEGGVCLITGA